MRLFYILLMIGMFFCFENATFAKHKTKHKTNTHKVKVQSTAKKTRSKITTPAAVATAATAIAVPSAIYGSSQLVNQLNHLISAENPNTEIAVYVRSMQNGETLYARNIHEPLTPASTMKILTAESALLYLGSDYRFSTQLLTDARSIRNGVLQGNLYIVLSGDPSLTYYDIVDLMANLQSQQIQAIAGNVYIDNTAYDQRFYGPGWVSKDKNYCYGAPISASIINHNCLLFQVSSGKPSGHSSQTIMSSKYFYPTIRNSVVTDVPEYNRTLFKAVLGQLGVRVYGSVTFGSAPDHLSVIGQHASQPLSSLITDMLKKSDNIIAGALFKKLGQLYTRQPGSWENGSYAVSEILSKRAGVNINGMRVLDGSGLSPDNLATPAQMMQVLDFAYHHHPTSYEFVSALPIAGVDGTLKHRMLNIARKVRAKTGTISGVISLAGYTVSGDKETLAFVIMINGNKGMGWKYKALEDKIVTSLTKYKR